MNNQAHHDDNGDSIEHNFNNSAETNSPFWTIFGGLLGRPALGLIYVILWGDDNPKLLSSANTKEETPSSNTGTSTSTLAGTTSDVDEGPITIRNINRTFRQNKKQISMIYKIAIPIITAWYWWLLYIAITSHYTLRNNDDDRIIQSNHSNNTFLVILSFITNFLFNVWNNIWINANGFVKLMTIDTISLNISLLIFIIYRTIISSSSSSSLYNNKLIICFKILLFWSPFISIAGATLFSLARIEENEGIEQRIVDDVAVTNDNNFKKEK